MRIGLFGASGGIGGQVLEQALAGGHAVRALTRDEGRLGAREGLTVVVGEVTDPAAMEAVVDGTGGVIWAVGAARNSPDQVDTFERGARNLVSAMERSGVSRLVALSGAGVTLPGERKPLGGRLMSAFVGLVVRHVVEAKNREYRVFSASAMEWTLVRPPRVVAGGPTGRYLVGEELRGTSVTQGDLADFMLRELVEREWVGNAPYIWSER
jgi:putative NADH-flavin reductase